MFDKDISILEKKLGFKFKNPKLIYIALTHKSHPSSGENNQRLEFLGDSILGSIIAHQLYIQFPKAKEGQLSRLKSTLVKGQSLEDLAESLDMGQHLVLGASERKSGGFNRASILEDTVEAIIGAVFIDGGFAAAQKLVLHLFSPRLDMISLDDAKSDANVMVKVMVKVMENSWQSDGKSDGKTMVKVMANRKK